MAASTGCLVGPDYRRPGAPVADRWTYAGSPRVATDDIDVIRWWQIFDDDVLDRLVTDAYRQNLTLQAAGLRVLQAQALRGVAIGGLYPHSQSVGGSYTHAVLSENTATPVQDHTVTTWSTSFDVAWELDLWGRFRRGIEAADASLLAAVADYDDALVSLVAEVASVYVQIRMLEERLALARENVRVQGDSLRIAQVRFEAGGTSELDVQQATTLLRDTEATIPQLEIQMRRAEDALCVLLGETPGALHEVLRPARGIPAAPQSVSIGIPADLLRRRPDVGRAERQLAAQSARIGVATADLLPHVQLSGSIGLSAEDAGRLFEGRAFEAVGGPTVHWDVLNYGRLINTVRFQDATFQELAARYAETVLRAQQEVEDALVGYVRGADQVHHLALSVVSANRAVELSLIQYREGANDYTTVLQTQAAKVRQEDTLTFARGGVTLSVIALFRALGGGWELRDGADVIPAATKQEMRARTWWGGMLDDDAREADVHYASQSAEGSWLRFLRWLPKW